MKSKLVIIGASGHGKVVADIALRNGYKEILFLDDNPNVKECMGFPVVGSSKDIGNYKTEFDVIVGIGNARIRQLIQEQLAAEFSISTLIHPSAIIGIEVTLGKGTVVMANAVVNPCSKVGNGCIINTGATVGHDCTISDYVHVSSGVHIAGTTFVGERTWVGVGTTVKNNVNICADCMIGAGTVIVRDIKESGTYVGVPAKNIKRIK